MAAAPREYELVLMLDPGREAPGRDAIAQEARGKIESAGTLKHENNWGLRKLAYEINQRTEADYRWFRFEAPNELLDQLNHSLRITDGVLRFRIFKVDPDAPVITPAATAAAPARDHDGEGRSEPAPRAEQASPAEEPAAADEPAPEQAQDEEPAAVEVSAEASSGEAGDDSGEPGE